MRKPLLTTLLLLFTISASLFSQQKYNSDIELVGVESCTVSLPGSFTTTNTALPDPFLKLDGKRITTKEEWTCRRMEILRLLERTVYGTKPAKPTNVTGTVSRTSITVNVGGTSFSVSVTMPTGGTAPYPLVIRYDNSGVPASNFTSNGVAVANLTTSSVGGGTRNNKTGAFYSATNSSRTGHLAAWAWGVSRIIDVIEADPSKLFDPTKIGVTGCSRDGKGALAAGVLDQRIALTMPMESGTGGMAAMRVSYANRDQSGGTNGAQSPSSAYDEQPWLGDDFSTFRNNPNTLPIDMHEAIALVAPRGFLAVYKTASSAGQWLGVPGSHVSAVAAAEVYKALGFGGNFAWLNTGTSMHCSWVDSYNSTVKDFIDIFLHRTKAPATAPLFTENNRPSTASWINWTTPALSGQLNINGEPVSGFALSVAASPSTSGSVTSTPATPASGRYEEGETVTLTPVPVAGWKFDGWSDDAAGVQSPLTVTMDGDKSITAKFVPTADCTTNSIKDGNFPGTALTSNWTLNQGQYYGNSAATSSVSGGKLTINITTAGTEAYQPQLVQKGITLDEGINYRLTFDASAVAARSIEAVFQNSSDYTTYASENFNLTTTQQTFTFEFEMASPSDMNTQFAFNVGGTGATQNVTISNVKLICIASVTNPVTLTLDPQEGTVEQESITVNSGSTLGALPIPTRPGYIFEGWFSRIDGEGTQYTSSSTLTADATAYAKWTEACSMNLVKDGDFPGTALTSNWALQTYGGSAATTSVSGGKVTINITTAGTQTYQPQLVQKGIALEEQTWYRLSFDASAPEERSINVMLQKSSNPYDTYASEDFNLTTAQQAFMIEFEMTNPSDPATQLSFNVGGTGATHNVTISNVNLFCLASTPTLVPEVAVEPLEAESDLHVIVLPNSAINVSFTATESGETELRLYSLNGTLLTSANIQTIAGQSYSHTFDQEKLSGGFYIVWKNSNGSIEHAKIVIAK